MSESTNQASAVIVGAGIVGNSLAYHLARLGWRDLILVDKGPMPNPGGSTGHASNFIFPIDYSKMMAQLTDDSSAQFKDLGVFTESGGLEIARTEARRQELRRRASAAKAWGIPYELLSPSGVAKLVPFINTEAILEGLYLPTVGVVDSLRAGTLMRERAQQMGALEVRANTEVLGIELSDDVRRVRRGAYDRRGHQHRHLRHLRRCVECTSGADGRGLHPTHTGRAPDDQCRADSAVRRHRWGDHLPGRPRHGPEHVRAPARRRHGGRVVRAPPDPRAARRDPIQRGGSALADRDALHKGRLRSTAPRRPRAHARDLGRREGRYPLRHQRAHLDDARRLPGAR